MPFTHPLSLDEDLRIFGFGNARTQIRKLYRFQDRRAVRRLRKRLHCADDTRSKIFDAYLRIGGELVRLRECRLQLAHAPVLDKLLDSPCVRGNLIAVISGTRAFDRLLVGLDAEKRRDFRAEELIVVALQFENLLIRAARRIVGEVRALKSVAFDERLKRVDVGRKEVADDTENGFFWGRCLELSANRSANTLLLSLFIPTIIPNSTPCAAAFQQGLHEKP